MAGFRTFATGEVLTAANVNDFLMKQSVMVFADDAARTTALGAEVAEGMLTYNEDTAQLEVFDGSAFIAAGSPGIGSNVVSTTVGTAFTTTSTAFVPITGLAAAITPTDDTAKVLVQVSGVVASSTDTFFADFRLMRGATVIAQATGGSTSNSTLLLFRGSGTVQTGTLSITFVDSPATTSSVTYSLETRILAGTGEITVGFDTTRTAITTITAIEVAA